MWKYRLSSLFIGLPILSLAVGLISLLRYGIDIPYWDDWGPYITGNMGSLNLKYLFQKANDTLMPVGYALESLAFKYLNGNAVAWQFLSMLGILGLLLFFQWRLLLIVLQDKLLAASAFVLTLIMLQPYSYWGLQSQAYIQALPLVFVMATIYLTFCQLWNPFMGMALFMLGILAGFSYINGAFAIFGLSIVFLCLGQYMELNERKQIIRSGRILLVAGVISILTQLWVIVFLQKGTHRADIPMAYPIESDFWIYMLGNIARSLKLHYFGPTRSLIILSLLLFYIFVLMVVSFHGLIRNRFLPFIQVKSHLIFLSIISVVFIHLSLISAGRADAQLPGAHSFTQIFYTAASGSSYYFWVTIIWPWVAAATFNWLRIMDVSNKIKLYEKVAMATPFILLPVLISLGMIGHSTAFKNLMQIRAEGIRCIANQLALGQDVYCPQLYPDPIKNEVFQNDALANASFFHTLLLARANV